MLLQKRLTFLHGYELFHHQLITAGHNTTSTSGLGRQPKVVAGLMLVFACCVQFNFEGRFDLVRFVKDVQSAGLYLILRIVPYVCAEWNLG